MLKSCQCFNISFQIPKKNWSRWCCNSQYPPNPTIPIRATSPFRRRIRLILVCVLSSSRWRSLLILKKSNISAPYRKNMLCCLEVQKPKTDTRKMPRNRRKVNRISCSARKQYRWGNGREYKDLLFLVHDSISGKY